MLNNAEIEKNSFEFILGYIKSTPRYQRTALTMEIVALLGRMKDIICNIIFSLKLSLATILP